MSDERDDVRAALAEIRREGRKATLVAATPEAVCVLLAVNLACDLLGVPLLDRTLGAAALASAGVPAPTVGSLVAVCAGVAAFAAAVAVRSRRPVEERFEAANPAVREALRTARDTAAADRSNQMARALYADVLDRLRETSSVGLVDTTRLVVAVLLAFALSVATVQTAVVGISLGGPTPASTGLDGSPAGSGDFENRSSVELRDGDEVLGDPTDVTAGSENLTADVGGGPGGEGEREWTYDGDSGGSSGDRVDAQRSGFDSPERVEDADLVRRYARKLQETKTTDD